MKIKLYLFDKTKTDCLGYDFSEYIEVGFTENRTLDGTIDTYGVNLLLPFEDKIEPSTKFIARIYNSDDEEDYEERHMVLQDDVVEKPIMSDDTLYIHRLSLADPAIIAQQRAVDNIAITYKLQDVNIETTVVDTDSQNDINASTWSETYPRFKFGWDNGGGTSYIRYYTCGNYYKWVYPTLTPGSAIATYSEQSTLTNLKKNYIYGTGQDQATQLVFDLPLLRYYYGVNNTKNYAIGGLIPVKFKIYAVNARTGNITYFYGSATDYAVATPSRYLNGDISWSATQGLPEMDNNFGYTIQYKQKYNKYCVQKLADDSYSTDTMDSTTNLPTNRRIVIDFIDDIDPYEYFVEIKKLDVDNDAADIGTSQSVVQAFYANNAFATKQVHFFQLKDSTFKETIQSEEVYNDDSNILTFNFRVYNFLNITQTISKPSEMYSAYYLFQKAQYASQMYFKDSGVGYLEKELSFTLNDSNKALLQSIKLVENFYQNKNLWEIFIEIGNYVHAKPIVKFNVEGQKDNFLLDFIKYGDIEYQTNKSTKDNVFNSRYFNEYISELTAYTTNLVQLGLTITELLKPSTSSEDYLVYNDSAILKTKYPILEIDKLEIEDFTVGHEKTVDITKYVYEYNTYKLLPFTNTYPSKQRALYYHLGSNVIEGMQYIAPQVNPGTLLYPIKVIIHEALDESGYTASEVVSNYRFKLTYKTKGNQRIEQFRPDLRKYLRNSQFDLYPIHTQYNNQEERYIDSEQLGKNLLGNLVRTGNTVYEITEWCNNTSELKDRGELYSIEDKNYYVSKVKNVYYIDHIESVVELTQDFNRLAQIIGIPSEPRFYEISEQSNITRDIAINDLYVLATGERAVAEDAGLTLVSRQNNNDGMSAIYIKLLFGEDSTYKYVLTYFKGDADKLFDTDSNTFNIGVLSSIVTYIHGNSITYSWEMEDNFSAGDAYGETGNAFPSGYNAFYRSIFSQVSQEAYKSLTPTRYTDIYGRADLVDFIFSKEVLSETFVSGDLRKEFSELMPNASNIYNSGTDGVFALKDYVRWFGSFTARQTPWESSMAIQGVERPTYYSPTEEEIKEGLAPFMSNSRGIYVVKDNREKIKFSYNFQLLSDSDRFIISKNVFDRNKKNVKAVAIWDKEINKLNDYVDSSTTTDIPYAWSSMLGSAIFGFIGEPQIPPGYTLDDIKALALVYGLDEYGRYKLIIGRNVSDLSTYDKFDVWALCKPTEAYFKTNTTQIEELVENNILPSQE